MTLYTILFLASLYVLYFDTPAETTITFGSHTYTVYNYVETSSTGVEIGVDFCVDETKNNYLYDDLWWSIKVDGQIDKDRLNDALTHMVNAEKEGFKVA